MKLSELNTKTSTFIIGWIDDNVDDYELVKKEPQKTEANGSAVACGSATKPPIGLVPKRITDRHRMTAITEAIERYATAKKNVPQEWFDELKELLAVV